MRNGVCRKGDAVTSFRDVSQFLYQFWSQFADGDVPIIAYKQGHVPEDENGNVSVSFPYITFSVRSGDFNADVVQTAFVWCKASPNVNVNDQKAKILDQIQEKIPEKVGAVFPLENGGALWLRRNVDFLSDYSPNENGENAPQEEPIIGGRISYLVRSF